MAVNQNVSLDTSDAGRGLDELNQKAKQLLATLQQIKASLAGSNIPSMSPTGGATAAASASATPGGGGAGLPIVQGVAGNGPQGIIPVINGGGNLNPSIQQAMLQSTQVGMQNPMQSVAGSGGGFIYQNNPGGGSPSSGYAFPASGYAPMIQRGANVVGQAFEMQTQLDNNGGSGIMERGRMSAHLLSLGAGATATALSGGNVRLGMMVAGVTDTVTTALSDYLNAPSADRAAAQASLMPYGGARYGVYSQKYSINEAGFDTNQNADRGYGPQAHGVMSGRLDRIVDGLHNRWAGTDLDAGANSRGAVAAVLGTMSSALFAGGQDPDAGSGVTYGATANSPFESYRSQFAAGQRGVGSRLIPTMIGIAGNAIINHARSSSPAGEETLAETYTRRLGELVGTKQAPEVEKQIAPIFATEPETGGNVADILTKYGAQNTATYLRLHNDDLASSVDPMTLARTSANMRGSERRARLGSFRARGSGAAMQGAFGDEMSAIASLPGGSDSEAYGEAREKMRGARDLAYHQRDVTEFDIPSMRLQGQRERANYLPFAPGNIAAMDIQGLNLNKKQINTLTSRMDTLKKSGELSEDGEARLVSQIENLKTQNAEMIGQLSMGMENRLPALSAGAPANAGRINSYQLASLNLNMMHNGNRSFGAVNGRQLKTQDDFIASLGGDTNELAPRSRTQAMNEGGGQLAPVLDRLANVLEKLTSQGAEPLRPGEMAGQMAGHLSQKDLGGQSPYRGRN